MIKPIEIWLKTSTMPAPDTGSKAGQVYKGYTIQVSAAARSTRIRTLSARSEKIGADIMSAEMRSIGHKKV
jgi:hypothetical protein